MHFSFIQLFDQRAVATIPAAKVQSSFVRLDAAFYCGGGANTRQALVKGGMITKPLSDLASVEQPTVFGKRFMQGTEEFGIPLYAASELLNHIPTTDTFLAKRLADRFACLIAQPGTLLLSRSGSVGRPVLVPPWLRGIAIQDDVLKITASDPRVTQYLYAYFMSPIGQPLLTDAAFGSVIQHIKVDHIRQLPVIVPSNITLVQVADLIAESIHTRGAARYMLEQVSRQLHEVNKLQPLKGIIEAKCSMESFCVPARAVTGAPLNRGECRLDAHFYNPTAQFVVASIRECPSEIKNVADLVKKVLMGPRFKRNYVESTHGVPFLSGKNIVQIRPTDLNYLSNLQMAEMQELVVRQGWTLITCSGTIGRTCFVWKNYEGYAASQHILRVIPDETEIDPGYLYAFLSSEYGYEQILRYRYGSVIDEVNDRQIEQVLVPCPPNKEQREIGDKVREAYEKFAEAIRLEDKAQAILMKELIEAPGAKGV